MLRFECQVLFRIGEVFKWSNLYRLKTWLLEIFKVSGSKNLQICKLQTVTDADKWRRIERVQDKAIVDSTI